MPEPVEAVRALFDALDRGNVTRIQTLVAEDAQCVDELSRRWLRGRENVAGYFSDLDEVVTDIRSELRDVHQVVWADTALVTYWLEQDYRVDGSRRHISAPSSFVLRLVYGEWRIALFHSIPLPESERE